MIAFDVWASLSLSRSPAVNNDFRVYYAAACLVLRHGWPSLYDFAAQRAEAAALGFYWQPFFNPPPMVALVLPLTSLPFKVALAVWTAALIAALVAAVLLVAPGPGLNRAAAVTLVAGLFPVAFGIIVGQVPALVALVLAVAWRLLASGRPAAGGAVLALVTIKPQLGFLLPLALLVSGRVRAALVSFSIMTALVLVSIALLGSGVGSYLAGLRAALDLALNHRFTLRSLLPAPWVQLLQAAAALAGLLAAWRLRRHPEAVWAAGISASMLVTPYDGIQDLTALAIGGLLILRLDPPRWQLLLLLLDYPLAEFALATGPVPLLLWWLVWLGSLALLSSDQLDRPVSARVGAAPPA